MVRTSNMAELVSSGIFCLQPWFSQRFEHISLRKVSILPYHSGGLASQRFDPHGEQSFFSFHFFKFYFVFCCCCCCWCCCCLVLTFKKIDNFQQLKKSWALLLGFAKSIVCLIISILFPVIFLNERIPSDSSQLFFLDVTTILPRCLCCLVGYLEQDLVV